MIALHVTVRGVPAPQGSMVVSRQGKVHHSSARVEAWRRNVAWSVRAAMRTQPGAGAFRVVLAFALARPASAEPDTPAAWPPDLDKLVRAVLDALTGIVWTDDAQVIALSATKAYAEGEPGVVINIEEIEEA